MIHRHNRRTLGILAAPPSPAPPPVRRLGRPAGDPTGRRHVSQVATPLPPPAVSGPKVWCVDHDCEVYASDPAHKFCDLMRGAQRNQRGVRSMGYSELPNERMPRLLSGFDSVDRFIGDRVSGDIGWVWNSVAILGGPPGSGKSTLLTHLADGFARSTGERVLYCTGEEAPDQVAARAYRLRAAHPNVHILVTTSWQEVLEEVAALDPAVVIIDSAQVMSVYGHLGPASSPAQLNALAEGLKYLAKQTGRLVICVGQYTKDEELAGTMQFQHAVDVVLYYAVLEDQMRIIRSTKNRFGATHDMVALRMTREGLVEAKDGHIDPLLMDAARTPGVVVFPALDGAKIIPTRVEAMVTPTEEGESRSFSARGFPLADLKRIVAAISRANAFSATSLLKRHISVDVRDIAGAKVNDPALDLAVAVAILSSALDLSAPPAFGRVTLAGNVERTNASEERVKTIENLRRNGVLAPTIGPRGVRGVRPVATLAELVDIFNEHHRVPRHAPSKHAPATASTPLATSEQAPAAAPPEAPAEPSRPEPEAVPPVEAPGTPSRDLAKMPWEN